MSYVITSDAVQQLLDNGVKLFVNYNQIMYSDAEFEIYDSVTIEALSGYELVKVGVGFFNPDVLGTDYKYFEMDSSTTGYLDVFNFTIENTTFNTVEVETKEAIVEPPKLNIPDYVLDVFKDNKIVLSVNGENANVSLSSVSGEVITATVESGFLIESISIGYFNPDILDTDNLNFTVADDKKTATLLTPDIDADVNITQQDITIVVDESGGNGSDNSGGGDVTPDTKGINDVFLLERDQVRTIIKDKFIRVEGGTDQEIEYNHGEYILGLVELPFVVNPDLKDGERSISLGGYVLDVRAETLNTDEIRINLGDITVPSVKSNFLDYKNTVANLHLPYCESVVLDINYVIDCVVNIEYIINLYNGMAKINIRSSKVDDVIFTKDVDLGVRIPFANLENPPNHPRDIEIGGDNGVWQPFIELLHNEMILENGVFTIPVIDETLLNEQSGFVKVQEIELISSATSSEKAMIENQLNNGVIIK